ncbi:hypothetical protein DL96DRAFT_1598568 [Flagelloscypha sp. PMI_526]|nr:hypothetical protein DL96DRAFT_1598568 [Flagelloscypha sp. PMI_526]
MSRVKPVSGLPDEDRYDCPMCNRSVRKKDRGRHTELHVPDSQAHWIYCPYFPCTVRVRARFFNNICQHVRSQHTRIPLKCPVCQAKGSSFETYQDGCMSRHYKKSHPGVKAPRWGRPEMPETTPEQQSEQHRLYLAENGIDDPSGGTGTHKTGRFPKHASLPGMGILQLKLNSEYVNDVDQDGDYSVEEDVAGEDSSPSSSLSEQLCSALATSKDQSTSGQASSLTSDGASVSTSLSYKPGHAPPRMIKAVFCEE